MDWKQILSLSNEFLDDHRKEEIYSELIREQKFDSKIAKKLFPLCLTVLKYKGDQVEKQREEIEMLVSSDIDLKATLELVEKQKKLISKHETERIQYKTRIKELTDEIAMIHGRELQGSDEDSPDQLSEIDRQQELMANISMKNKHIKRLLHDIEKLEEQSSEQLHVIRELKTNVDDAAQKIELLSTQLAESASSVTYLEDKINNLNNQIHEQEAQNDQLIIERKDREKEMEIFSAQLEKRVMMYKEILDEKQRELDVANEKYINMIDQLPGIDVDSEQSELKKMLESLKERDSIIKTFEDKIGILSTELMDATSIITQLNNEKEDYMRKLMKDKNDQCCRELKTMLENSNTRCKELQEMLQLAEDDNILKAKQAFEAIEMLKSYENSEDGLADALTKIHKLQENLHQRDKKIHELVVDLNSMNEVVAENSILRKRLGIPEDDYIETKSFLAKQRKVAKINDRLMLKLRASEEMRLQLKIDKNDLKRKIALLEAQLNERSMQSSSNTLSGSSKPEKLAASSPVEIKTCENCLESYNIYESLKYCRNCIMKQNSNLCENCMKNLKVSSNENIELIKKIAKLEIDHQSVTEENENLRIGLNEILEKLRDYEGSSERRIINPATLEKLLYILNLRSTSKVTEAAANQEAAKPVLTFNNETEKDSEIMQLKMLVKELSDKNDAYKIDLESMKVLKKQYDEFVRSSELCDDDKNQLLMKSLQRCHEFEKNLKMYERKIDFLKNENDHINIELRELKISSLSLISELKLEILNKNQEMLQTEDNKGGDGQNEEIIELTIELQQIRSQLNGLCFGVLKNIKSIDNENIMKLNLDQVTNVTVLENNQTTSFITRNELTTMHSKLKQLQETIESHETKEKHLEELVTITQSQLLSQQAMLSQFSDEEISTRHLIVDLQSQSNENYLLAKTTRDLNVAKEREDHLKLKMDQKDSEIRLLQGKLDAAEKMMNEKCKELKDREGNNLLKIEYLKKTLVDLCNQYSTMTPIYLIADFVKHYAAVLEMKNEYERSLSQLNAQNQPQLSNDLIISQLKDISINRTDIESKIEIIKHKSSCEYLKQQLEMREAFIKELRNEIASVKMNEVRNVQHWNAIRMLFGATGEISTEKPEKKIHMVDKEVQVTITRKDFGTNTDAQQAQELSVAQQLPVAIENIQNKSPVTPPSQEASSSSSSAQSVDFEQKSVDCQLKKALILASSRSALLIETENRLSEAQGRIKALERNLENREKQLQKERNTLMEQQEKTESPKKDDHILSITIATLQNLLLEKDTTLSRYQELLKSERQHHSRTYDEMTDELKQLKKTIDGQEIQLNDKNKFIEKLKVEIAELELAIQVTSKVPSPVVEHQPVHHVHFQDQENELRSLESKLKDANNDAKHMEQQIKDLLNIEHQLNNQIREKDATIKNLNIKLKATNDSLDTLSENMTSTAEIDQLRDMLEEKDKHIQDLTETLNQFHDDQQKYINDSAFNSAEQVHLISADLNRAEATNRVLKTQLEALKRQVTNIQQREKQAREMIKTLKNQLIKRPVISVKSDKRPATQREEQQQKRIHELENELMEVKDELRRQTNINDNKKAKNAAELGLWDKQKRFQEMSEKLKAKLTEKEIDCERMKANFQIAKNTITRLEREKSSLENKIKNNRFMHNASSRDQHSCPQCNVNQKYSVAETPSTALSEIDSEMNSELVGALKARIESQQRRIIAYELDGKGSNAFALEMERLHEQLSALESQNIRLEAKNIQLQLDFDLLKQTDTGQRQEARIKHLEDYILILKDELSQAHAKLELADYGKASKHHHEHSVQQHQAMEQTILTLKRVIEKLKVENKYLKDAKHVSSVPSTATYMSQTDRKKEELFERLKMEHEKLQKSNKELLSKISTMQIELELSQAQAINVSCPHCNRNNELAAQGDADVLSQQLQQKTLLLDKAKTLLSRAAAKEKNLREQITYLKRRVSDLEGVPVISEENSESG